MKVFVLSLVFITVQWMESAIIENSQEIYDSSGENITGEIENWATPDLIFDCNECVKRKRVFLRYNVSSDDRVQDYVCLDEKEIRKMDQTAATQITHFVCTKRECGYPYVKYPYSLGQITCAFRMHYPTYLGNVRRIFPMFSEQDLIRFVNKQNMDWEQFQRNFTSVWARRFDCIGFCDVEWGPEDGNDEANTPWIYPEDREPSHSIWSSFFSFIRWFHGF